MSLVLTDEHDAVHMVGGARLSCRAAINASDSGDNAIVAAVPGKIIRVLQYLVVCAAAVEVSWESSGGTVISGPCAFGTNGGAAPPYNPLGHFQTLPGETLNLVLGGAVQVGGHLTYVLIG